MELKGDVLIRIKDMIPRMSKSQKKIAFYIQNEYETAVFMTAAELGKETGVSESTIVRFASALGYDGYPEFQKALVTGVKKQPDRCIFRGDSGNPVIIRRKKSFHHLILTVFKRPGA